MLWKFIGQCQNEPILYLRQGREIPNKPLNLLILRKIKCLTYHTINRGAENKI